ncbi:MAG: DUF4301 family protein, partial [Bacteroidales bacterium]|nr:DUF4301 family protein [Bacteroidales bacterium]
MFTEKDLAQIRSLGISLEEIERQVNIFRNGIDFVRLVKPATAGDGIESLQQSDIEELIHLFEQNKNSYSIIRFVPASGAASRMFKTLFEAMEVARKEGDRVLKSRRDLMDFFENLNEYPFFPDLEIAALENGYNLNELVASGQYSKILELILNSNGLNYGALPKGLLKFHSYPGGNRTAFEEHYEETSLYLYDNDRNIHLHFTVSPEHLPLFSKLSELLNAKYSEEKGLKYEVQFSVQKPATDTLAVDSENQPFRLEDGSLLFRPGGHGALIDNLGDLKESIVFIGNIDNVSPDHTKEFRVRYKKFLGGFLIRKMEEVFSILDRVDMGDYGEELRKEALAVIKNLSPGAATELANESSPGDFILKLRSYLNRPMRVCGMVRNSGEPGGGPFWVMDSKGRVSKQIIESSQINLEDPEQKKIFHGSTHFNPVDLVCCISDHRGNNFDLNRFIDPEMAFIAHK